MTLRLLALAALLALVGLPGCLEEDARDPPAAGEDTPAPVATVTRSGTTDLGSRSGTALTPSRFDFDVVVPPGGATDVRWQITVDLAPGSSVLATVEGPGCSDATTSFSIAVGGSSTYGGGCADLDEGTHAFAVVVTAAMPAFLATVTGTATVVYAVDDGAGA